MMTEKLTPIERILLAASHMPASQARKLLELICRNGLQDVIPRGRMTRAESIHRKRDKTAESLQEAVGRVLTYAKHETLRNMERHMRSQIKAQDEPTPENESPTARVVFNADDFQKDLVGALEGAQVGALETGGQELYDEIGKDDPFRMPAQETVDFLRHRQNLLSGVSDEVHREVEDELAAGIKAQEPLKELIKRISGKFEEIYQGRGKVVADTETAAAYGFARNQAMKSAGIKRKKWLHSPLALVPRPEHVEANGTVAPFDEPFPVGDPPLMYPHDPNGAPGDVINCHCIAIPIEE